MSADLIDLQIIMDLEHQAMYGIAMKNMPPWFYVEAGGREHKYTLEGPSRQVYEGLQDKLKELGSRPLGDKFPTRGMTLRGLITEIDAYRQAEEALGQLRERIKKIILTLVENDNE